MSTRRKKSPAAETATAMTWGDDSIDGIPEGERPRERLLSSGSARLSEIDLIALILRTGRPGQSVMGVARELIEERGGLIGLNAIETADLVRFGLGEARAASVVAAFEIGRRLAKGALLQNSALLDQPEAVARYLGLRFGRQDQEVVGALLVDVRNRHKGEIEVFRGTLCRTAVEPRAILRSAIQRGAFGVILFHTHPSGDPSPSLEDFRFTERMREAGDLLGVRLVDHIILGNGGRWVSLQRLKPW
jgi:DNA repair protein RadC